MSVAVLDLPTPTLSASTLLDFSASMFDSLRAKAEGWETLSESEREVFASLVYGLLEQPRTLKAVSYTAVGAAVTMTAKLTKQQVALKRAQTASYLLITEVLNQIERTNPEYQATLESAITEALKEIDSGKHQVVLHNEQEIRDYFRTFARAAVTEL
jgi:hypothetical protein